MTDQRNLLRIGPGSRQVGQLRQYCDDDRYYLKLKVEICMSILSFSDRCLNFNCQLSNWLECPNKNGFEGCVLRPKPGRWAARESVHLREWASGNVNLRRGRGAPDASPSGPANTKTTGPVQGRAPRKASARNRYDITKIGRVKVILMANVRMAFAYSMDTGVHWISRQHSNVSRPR
jgi:hypothetical protein